LLRVARAYARSTKYAEATISRRMHGTDKFLREFEEGKRTITLRQLERVLVNFKKVWPRGLPYPPPPKLSPMSKHRSKAKRESVISPSPEGDGRDNGHLGDQA
jgi:hypothetical protein